MRSRPLGDSGITLIEDFLSPAECALLIDKARPGLRRSQAVGANEHVVDRVRTSSQAIVFNLWLRERPAFSPARGEDTRVE